MAILSIDDGIEYKTHHEALNDLFTQYLGKTYKFYQSGWKHIVGKYYIWFPTLACKKNGVWIPGSKDSSYVDILQNGGEEILEYSPEKKPAQPGSDDTLRIVFAKEKNGNYSFIGLYKSAYTNEAGYNYLRKIHRRIATKINTAALTEATLEEETIQNTDRVLKIPNLSETEKDAVVKIRVGQSIYRDNLLKKHNCRCMLCHLGMKDLLIASHIKAWSESENREKLDSENGLLLCALHDALFDKHLITFDEGGAILISQRLSTQDILLCNINPSLKISMSEPMKRYMEHHRNRFNDLNR